ncbi:unnamed protein product [Bursaphelenchus xylophilus]|uniref:(pine wood nematode) hypothetical protein n=1 Tax=Bursaphelenchus xylophilus TaxID=6326 RepID=A0A1I7SL87_BURXY|nr:unnamed protein product [Bursaphelenchus xylophilus]CAG9129413.1 unnamed protein product [Bursaphelenchus xylophilus]
MAHLFIALILLKVGSTEAQLSCVYCHKGDELDVASLYRFMSFDSYFYKENSHDDCGKENATSLKYISCAGQCAYGTMMNFETNVTSIATGCYDESAPPSPIIIEAKGVSKELNIYPCSMDECNAALESAQENRTRTMTPPPTTIPPTTTRLFDTTEVTDEDSSSEEETTTTAEPSASPDGFTFWNFILPLVTLSFLY